jgi:hypothetical protein
MEGDLEDAEITQALHEEPVYKKPQQRKERITSEAYFSMLEEQDLKKQLARQKAFRYEHRRSIDEIARSILNGEIFDRYAECKQFPTVPVQFESHEEYREIWQFLFGYELVSELANSRRDVPKDQIGLAGMEMKS